jgi:low temperature requirement protein LtrA
VTDPLVVTAALLGLATAVCLWWLYFENAASSAGKALATLGPRRAKIADAYAFIHLVLIAGVIYFALGVERVIAHVAGTDHEPVHEASLHWTEVIALYGGIVLYLTGRIMFLRFTVRHTPPAQIVTVAVVLLLLPAARILSALPALGLLAAVLAGLVTYERLTWEPTAAAR